MSDIRFSNLHIKGDLEYLYLSNKAAEAKIAFQGAHLFHFQAKGKKPLLWLSESAVFKTGVPIRGGVPLCWPWFGPHPTDTTLSNHGFARTALWEHLDTQEISETETKVSFGLKSSPHTLKLWPYRFELTLEISISDELRVTLVTKNTDTRSFAITEALHTYLAVENIDETYVDGLDQKYYYNKVDDSVNNLQKGKVLFKEETDRIYQGVDSAVCLHGKKERVQLKTEGSSSLVVWNPGKALAEKMPDLSDHKTMLCLESAHALDDVAVIQPNQSHSLTTIITQA